MHGIAGVSGSTEIVIVIKIGSKSMATFLQVVKTSRRKMDNIKKRSPKYHLYFKGLFSGCNERDSLVPVFGRSFECCFLKVHGSEEVQERHEKVKASSKDCCPCWQRKYRQRSWAFHTCPATSAVALCSSGCHWDLGSKLHRINSKLEFRGVKKKPKPNRRYI